MSLPRFIVDEAIVLKRVNYGEADRLITMVTKEHGRLTVLAKGVRKLNSKKSSHLEPFVHVKVSILGSYSLPLVTQAQTINSHGGIRSDFEKTRLAFRVLELTERLTHEGEGYFELFEDLENTLQEIEVGGGKKAARKYMDTILISMGFGSIGNMNEAQAEVYLEKILDKKLSSNLMV